MLNTKDLKPKDNTNNNTNEFKYDPYSESEAVTNLKSTLDTHLANKPGEYNSLWQTQLNGIMDQITNREKFSYDVNGDALYQQYKDKYIQQGKIAMQDAMGQAAAMTGGYGNSYAASVGNQAYQASLSQLNDVIPELYQMAYDRYNQEGQNLLNQYSMYADRENTDYGRYRDTVSDFNTETNYLTNRYDTERSYDYGKYSDDKSYAYNDYRNAIADEQWQKNFDESVRQFEVQTAASKDQSTGKYVPTSAPTLTAEQYNDVLMNAEAYADVGETALANYLNGMVARGLSQDEAANILEQYFPIKKVPNPKGNNKPTGATSFNNGAFEFTIN